MNNLNHPLFRQEADEQPESPIYSDRKQMNNLNHPFIQTGSR